MNETEAPKNVRWDNHQTNLQTMFSHQLDQGRFCDVTLACQGGQTLKAHRAVLCAASGYFDTVLSNSNWDKEMLVIVKDIPKEELKLIIEFVYKGEISVQQVSGMEVGLVEKSKFSVFFNKTEANNISNNFYFPLI